MTGFRTCHHRLRTFHPRTVLNPLTAHHIYAAGAHSQSGETKYDGAHCGRFHSCGPIIHIRQRIFAHREKGRREGGVVQSKGFPSSDRVSLRLGLLEILRLADRSFLLQDRCFLF